MVVCPPCLFLGKIGGISELSAISSERVDIFKLLQIQDCKGSFEYVSKASLTPNPQSWDYFKHNFYKFLVNGTAIFLS